MRQYDLDPKGYLWISPSPQPAAVRYLLLHIQRNNFLEAPFYAAYRRGGRRLAAPAVHFPQSRRRASFSQQHARNQTSRIINSFLSGGRCQARIITKQLSAGVGNFGLHLFDCRFHLIPRAVHCINLQIAVYKNRTIQQY